MKLFTKAQKEKLIKNHHKMIERKKENPSIDFKPVVKLFTSNPKRTWLLTMLNPKTNIVFGIADLGLGFTSIGGTSIERLKSFKNDSGSPIKRDLRFKGHKPLSKYFRTGQYGLEIDFS